LPRHCPHISDIMSAILTRTVREVSSRDQDKTVPDSKILKSLFTVLHTLHDNGAQSAKNAHCAGVMYNALGYEIKKMDSTIPGAGKGVFVTKGTVPAKSLVALYPGMIKTEVLLTDSHTCMFCFVLVLGIYFCLRAYFRTHLFDKYVGLYLIFLSTLLLLFSRRNHLLAL